MAIGLGSQTNEAGISQLKHLLDGLLDELIVIRLPDEIFHLAALISLVDSDLALVDARLLPLSFTQRLIERGMRLLEMPEAERVNLACNVLAVAPRKCIMVAGNLQTRQLLEQAEVEVGEY